MTDKFKPARERRKPEPVKRVSISADERAAYEKAATERADKHESYARHLPSDKGR